MRGALAILTVAVLVGLAWLAFGAGRVGPAPPAEGAAAQEPPASFPDPMVVERVPVPEPEAERVGVDPRAITPPSPVQIRPLEEGMGRVHLSVEDAVTNRPILQFKCAFTAPKPGKAFLATAGEAFLDLPVDLVGDLLTEAKGYTPDTRLDFSVTPANPEILLTVYLNPIAPFSGIEIHAVDDQGAPVAHLQVSAWRAEDLERPLWCTKTKA